MHEGNVSNRIGEIQDAVGACLNLNSIPLIGMANGDHPSTAHLVMRAIPTTIDDCHTNHDRLDGQYES